MQIVLEKDASIRKDGGSLYLLLEEPFFMHLGIERPDERGVIGDHDVKIAMGMGKHGKFVFLYSPNDQKKWQKKLKKDQEE